MEVSNSLWGVVILYIVISVIAGNFVSRKSNGGDASEYYHTYFPPMVVALACTGTAISGVAFIGTPGTTFIQGVGLWAVNAFSGILGVVLCNVVLGKPLKRINTICGSITVTDLLVHVYDDHRFRYICVPCLLLVSVVFTACQWQSIGIILNTLMGIDYIPAVLLGVGVVSLYSIFVFLRGEFFRLVLPRLVHLVQFLLQQWYLGCVGGDVQSKARWQACGWHL